MYSYSVTQHRQKCSYLDTWCLSSCPMRGSLILNDTFFPTLLNLFSISIQRFRILLRRLPLWEPGGGKPRGQFRPRAEVAPKNPATQGGTLSTPFHIMIPLIFSPVCVFGGGCLQKHPHCLITHTFQRGAFCSRWICLHSRCTTVTWDFPFTPTTDPISVW